MRYGRYTKERGTVTVGFTGRGGETVVVRARLGWMSLFVGDAGVYMDLAIFSPSLYLIIWTDKSMDQYMNINCLLI